jgi:hypothetical protein
MGQYFLLLNLDKRQCMSPLGGIKLGEFFFDGQTAKAFLSMIMDPKTSWNGDRVIIVGDYQRDLPPSLADIWETTLKDIPRAQDSDEGSDEEGIRNLYGLGDVFEEVRRRNFYSIQGHSVVLRNLSKLEYVRADDFCCKFDFKRCSISQW